MKNKSVRIESDGPQTSSVILITRTDPFKYHHHDDNYDHTCEVCIIIIIIIIKVIKIIGTDPVK